MRPHPHKTILALIIVLLLLLMVTYPATIYRGAMNGISLWWRIVFPSLLPFFIVTELLLALGMVHFLSALLEPLTQKVFRLPGAAAFGLAVGFTSGYPMGAAVAARLRLEGLLSAKEAAKLAAFANNASPLFIFVAVAVGMFQSPQLGPFLAGIHYASNILTGLTFALFTRPPAPCPVSPWRRAVEVLAKTQRADVRNIGQLAGEAVRHAINNLFTIAGFICLFAVIFQLFAEVPLFKGCMNACGKILQQFGVPEELWPAVGAGFFEITLGAKTAAAAAVPLNQKLLLTEAILSWGGLSVVMQALSFLAAAKVSGGLFLLGRALQAVYACLFTHILFPVFAPRFSQPAALVPPAAPSFTATLAGATLICFGVNVGLLALGLLTATTGSRLNRRARKK